MSQPLSRRRLRRLRSLLRHATSVHPGAYLFLLRRRKLPKNKRVFYAPVTRQHGILLALRQLVDLYNHRFARGYVLSYLADRFFLRLGIGQSCKSRGVRIQLIFCRSLNRFALQGSESGSVRASP